MAHLKSSLLFGAALVVLAAGATAQTMNTAWTGAASDPTNSSTIDGVGLTVSAAGNTLPPAWEGNRTINLGSLGFTTLTGDAHTFSEGDIPNDPANDPMNYLITLDHGFAFTSDLKIIFGGPNASPGVMWSFPDFTGLSIDEQRTGDWNGDPGGSATTAFSVSGTDVSINSGSGVTAIMSTTGAAGLNSFRIELTHNSAQTFEEEGFAIYGSVVAVPEPSSALFLALAGLGVLSRRRR